MVEGPLERGLHQQLRGFGTASEAGCDCGDIFPRRHAASRCLTIVFSRLPDKSVRKPLPRHQQLPFRPSVRSGNIAPGQCRHGGFFAFQYYVFAAVADQCRDAFD